MLNDVPLALLKAQSQNSSLINTTTTKNLEFFPVQVECCSTFLCFCISFTFLFCFFNIFSTLDVGTVQWIELVTVPDAFHSAQLLLFPFLLLLLAILILLPLLILYSTYSSSFYPPTNQIPFVTLDFPTAAIDAANFYQLFPSLY